MLVLGTTTAGVIGIVIVMILVVLLAVWWVFVDRR
jgi:hypothetical protein